MTMNGMNIFNPNDYETTNLYKLALFNSTSGGGRIDHDDIQLEMFTDSGVVFSQSIPNCQTGHKLIVALYPNEKIIKTKSFPKNGHLPEADFLAVGKVFSFDTIGDRHYIEINFNQFTEIDWQKIKEQYSSLQERANTIVNKIQNK